MQDSITIAEVGSMVKVSGSRIATPFGPPRPRTTRTKKPCINKPKASMEGSLVPEGRFERSLWHDDVKRDIEGHEHDRCEQESGQQRLPQRDPSDQPNERGDHE